MGAKEPFNGSGVKAEAAICRGLAGLTAMVGSLSWWVSPLNDLGIMFMTRTAGEDAWDTDFRLRFLPAVFDDRDRDFPAARLRGMLRLLLVEVSAQSRTSVTVSSSLRTR